MLRPKRKLKVDQLFHHERFAISIYKNLTFLQDHVATIHEQQSACMVSILRVIEISVSCASHRRDFCGVCSNLSPTSFSFSSVSTHLFALQFLLRIVPASLNLVTSFYTVSLCGSGTPGYSEKKLPYNFPAKIC